jgi:hypothetical protein
MDTAIKRKRQHTAWAAVLATGAELSRRGYDVTFTLGNTARLDMLCCAPNGKAFKVQVKGLSDKYGFYIDKSFFEGEDEDLFLVVVLVPLAEDGAFQFFVLSHAEAKEEFSKMPKIHQDGTPLKESGPGFNWGSVKGYPGWGSLYRWLSAKSSGGG